MSETPPEPDSSAPTPKVHVEPIPVPDAGIPPAEGAGGCWSFGIGDVLDLAEKGRFTVKDRLGRGGMGEVYRAEYVAPLMTEPVQVFALKVLRPDADPQQQRTFAKEVRLLSLLCHESIAHYHTSFVYEGRLVLMMEYVEGRSLYSVLRLAWRKCRFPSESSSLELVAQVAEALDYAHQAKDEQGHPLHIVHRDISPDNILITQTGLAKVVDFGIAKADLADRTQTFTNPRLIKGKVPYLSPEQVERRPLDGRADLFSLACVLVEMLTAEPPFGRAVHAATLRAIAQVTPEEVDRATRGLSQNVRAICRKALARDPAERFATGHEMAEALLAQHRDLGPSAVRDEIAAWEALPDMSRDDVKKQAARLTWVRRKQRALVAVGGLALAALFALSARSASRSTLPGPAAPPVAAAPREQRITPIPEQGTATAKVVVTPSSDLAPGKRSAVPGIVATKKARIPVAVVAPPPAGMHVSLDSDESISKLEANYVKVSGEALSPPHAIAALFATGNSQVTRFVQMSRHRLKANGVDVFSEVWKEKHSDMVAVIVDLTNPDDAPSWEPNEGRVVSDEHSSIGMPVAVRAMPRVIPPGQRGRVVLVFNRSVIGEKAMVEILRGSRPEFGMEVSSQDLEQRKSLWPF